MNASWVVVVTNSWGWVNLHTAVAHRVVVAHTVEVVAAVRIVMVVAGSMVAVAVHKMTTAAGSGHCPSVIPPGLRAVLLPRVVPLYQVQLIFSLLKRWEAEFFGYGVNHRRYARPESPDLWQDRGCHAADERSECTPAGRREHWGRDPLSEHGGLLLADAGTSARGMADVPAGGNARN